MKLPCLLGLVVLAGVAGACSTPEGSIELTTGGETDTFTRAPKPTSITVEALDADGKSETLFSGPIGATLDLGERDRSKVAALVVTAKDDAGVVRVRGRTLALELGVLEKVALKIYVQRTGETARAPGTFDGAREAPILDTVQGRYVLAAGGGLTSVAFYDLLGWTQAPASPTLKAPPDSLVVLDTQLLSIAGASASVYDLATGTSADVSTPAGSTFAAVAGGRTIYAPDGGAYVVGATRTSGEPTTAVLRITKEGTLSFANLAAPRLGAGATWVDGRGVVVVGGSASAPGAEVLPVGGAQGAALPYPPEPAAGLGAVALDAGRVVVAGAEVKLVDLACANACTLQPWAKLPVALTRAEAFTLGGVPNTIWALGAGADGLSHLVRVAPDKAEEIPLKTPRKQARAIVGATGQLFVVGGAPGVETFVP